MILASVLPPCGVPGREVRAWPPGSPSAGLNLCIPQHLPSFSETGPSTGYAGAGDPVGRANGLQGTEEGQLLLEREHAMGERVGLRGASKGRSFCDASGHLPDSGNRTPRAGPAGGAELDTDQRRTN